MINFIRMKRNEWKVKAMFYAAIATLFDNQKELITKLAETIHDAINMK